MNLADRFLRVAKANLNSILQAWEDPEKVREISTFSKKVHVSKIADIELQPT